MRRKRQGKLLGVNCETQNRGAVTCNVKLSKLHAVKMRQATRAATIRQHAAATAARTFAKLMLGAASPVVNCSAQPAWLFTTGPITRRNLRLSTVVTGSRPKDSGRESAP